MHSGTDRERELSYAYLGGGVTNEPPHCYGIVCKHMPIGFADCLMSLLHCVGGVAKPQIIRRQNRNIQKMLDEKSRELSCNMRRLAIQAQIEKLDRHYSSGDAMLSYAFQKTATSSTLGC